MYTYKMIHQPRDGGHAGAIAQVVDDASVTSLRAAMAYVTTGGATTLLKEISRLEAGSQRWSTMRKRWLVGIDWLRSDPPALERLSALPASKVRVFDGARLVGRPGCYPYQTWHPKLYILAGADTTAVIHGSANLSRNGLNFGHEVGSLSMVAFPRNTLENHMMKTLNESKTWFDTMWRSATPWADIRLAYGVRFSDEAISRQATVDDDNTPSDIVGRPRGGIPAGRLIALRACRNLWIEAGNLHHNRGPARPGNQLMMSAMTRVFFDKLAEDVVTDSPLGSVSLQEPGTKIRIERPLRFSNNSMDVLALPVPTAPWPSSYDQAVLLFTRVTVSADLCFELRLGTAREAQRWRRASQRQSTAYRMTSGRAWGVFN